MLEGAVRINKYLASSGLCSRREADRLIAEGRVLIDGEPAGIGAGVLPGQSVTVDGESVAPKTRTLVFAYHKPRGVVCTDRDEHAARTLAEELAGRPELEGVGHLLYIGRLDRESEGLLLLTSDGMLKRRLESADSGTEKEYLVTTDALLSEEAKRRMEAGVYLAEPGITTKPCRIFRDPGAADARTFHIVLTEGKNRQIRRMCETQGLRVRRLIRIREAGIRLDGLCKGEIRELTGQEIESLMQEG